MMLLQFLLLLHMAGVICANTPYNQENNNQRISGQHHDDHHPSPSSNGNYEQRNYQGQEKENNKEEQINTQDGRRRDQDTGINERRETDDSYDYTNENDDSLDDIRKKLKEELLRLRENEKEKKVKNKNDNKKEGDEDSLDNLRILLKDELLELRKKDKQKPSIKENANNKYNISSNDDTEEQTESPDDIRKRLKDDLKKLRDINEHKQETFITLSFLKMCMCDSDNATKALKHFLAKAEESQNSSNGKNITDEVPLVPDFKGNNSAKVEFYRHLTPDQNYSLFESDLIKSMCKAAKLFIMETKIPIDRIFPTNNSLAANLKSNSPVDVNKNNET